MYKINFLNIFKKEKIPFLLLLFFFSSFYFGNLIINFIILLFFIYFFFNLKNFEIEYLDKIIILFGIYLFLVSFLNFQYFLNHFLFLKFIILFLSIKIVFNKIDYNEFKSIITICSLFLLFLIFDIYYQKLLGIDIFGYDTPRLGGRLSGPFGDELIPGSIILHIGFYFFLYLYLKLLNDEKTVFKIYALITLVIFIVSVLITGERISFLSACLSIFLILLIVDNKKLHFFFILISLSICFLVILNDNKLNLRYEKFVLLLKPQLDTKHFHQDEIDEYIAERNEISNKLNNENNLTFLDTTWGAHFLTAYELIKKKPIFGNGLKSFRDLCGDQNIESLRKRLRCSTHPHNMHLELLSEIGIIGYFIFLLVLILVLYEATKIIINRKKYSKELIFAFFAASLILTLTIIFPFKSTGRLSSTFFGSLFWINFSILNSSIYYLKKRYLKD